MLFFKEFGGLFPTLTLLGLKSRLRKGAKGDPAQAVPCAHPSLALSSPTSGKIYNGPHPAAIFASFRETFPGLGLPSTQGEILGPEFISLALHASLRIKRERDEVKRTRAVFVGFPKRRAELALSQLGARWSPHT